MIRRISVVAGIGLALVLGGRYAWNLRSERAFETRKRTLLEQALWQPEVHRPWEARFEALDERLRTSPLFGELVESNNRPYAAWGAEEPRHMDEFEVLWVEAAWTEFVGLESTLAALRGLRPAELEWHGEALRLYVLRECVNAVCARAWLAVERGDDTGAAGVYADAVRLTMATDDGTTLGLMMRTSCTNTALASARSALTLGLSARALHDALAPLLLEWDFRPERAERRIRRDLAALADFDPLGSACVLEAESRATALEWIAPVEEALAIARLAASASPWADASPGSSQARPALDSWTLATRQLHAMHARRNVALSALAVAAFREEHGTWPTSLESIEGLRDEVRGDTLTGTSLDYSAEGETARVGPAGWGRRVEAGADDERSLYRWTLFARSFP